MIATRDQYVKQNRLHSEKDYVSFPRWTLEMCCVCVCVSVCPETRKGNLMDRLREGEGGVRGEQESSGKPVT